MAGKKQDGATSEQLRALRDIKLADAVDPAVVARTHEAAFLSGFNSAQRELDWLIDHSAWTLLGYESAAGWWDARVKPVMVQLEMRPTPEMCGKILAKVREEERALPRSQRRTQRELESLTLASEWLVRGRAETRNRRSAAGSDLGDQESPAKGGIAAAANGMKVPPADPGPDAAPTPLRGISQDRAMDLAKVVGEAYGLPTNLDAAVSGDVEAPPSPVQGGIGDGGQAERVESHDSPPTEPAEPGELTSPLSGEADPEQDGTGVTRPAPDPSDPAALLEWFAERWEQVDADVSGPLLTDDDVLLLEASLNRVVFTFELLIKWRDRAQP